MTACRCESGAMLAGDSIYNLISGLVACCRTTLRCGRREISQPKTVGVFLFVDQKVENWSEYVNPEIAHAAFAEFAVDE